MGSRAAAWLAWSSFALALLILAAGLIIRSPDASFFLLFALIATPFAIVGALVASRRPRNPIGWFFWRSRSWRPLPSPQIGTRPTRW